MTLTVEGDENTFLYFAFGSNLLKKRISVNSPSAAFVGVGRLYHHRLGFTGSSDVWQGGVANIFASEDTNPDGSCSESSDGDHSPLIHDVCDETGDVCIWGSVWRISNHHLSSLDRQEGVDMDIYAPCKIHVDLFEGGFGVPSVTIDDSGSSDSEQLRQLVAKINLIDETQQVAQQQHSRVSVRTYKKVKDSVYFPDNTSLARPSGKRTRSMFVARRSHTLVSCGFLDSYLLVILKGAIESGLPLRYTRKLASLLTNQKVAAISNWRFQLRELN